MRSVHAMGSGATWDRRASLREATHDSEVVSQQLDWSQLREPSIARHGVKRGARRGSTSVDMGDVTEEPSEWLRRAK